METNQTPEQQLREVERAQTAPWVDYPPTPNWYYPTVGVWLAAFCLTIVKVVTGNPIWLLALAAVLIAEFVFMVWMKRQRGALPNMRTVPTEFEPLVKWFLVVAVVIVAVSFGLLASGFHLAGFVVCAVATTIGLYVYEQKFEAAAERARTRLGLA